MYCNRFLKLYEVTQNLIISVFFNLLLIKLRNADILLIDLLTVLDISKKNKR